jgi:hypothetical protein
MAMAAPETKARPAAPTTALAFAAALRPSLLVAVLACVAWGVGQLPPAARAGLPQPMCVYYGQARDGYGLPYRTNAEVVLVRGTQEVARQRIQGSLTPGVNFALYVHVDDGRTTNNYSARAVRSGEAVAIVVRDQGGQHTIMEQRTVPNVSQPGDLILIDATASDDADNDGLPDTWERELVEWSGGALASIWDVRGSDDYDGDGMSNLDEYRAGTFAFLDYDLFYISTSICTSNNRLGLTFLSVPGKCYSASWATNLTQAVWTACPFALSDTGAVQNTPAQGNGDWLSLYLPIQEPKRFFRLTAR